MSEKWRQKKINDGNRRNKKLFGRVTDGRFYREVKKEEEGSKYSFSGLEMKTNMHMRRHYIIDKIQRHRVEGASPSTPTAPNSKLS